MKNKLFIILIFFIILINLNYQVDAQDNVRLMLDWVPNTNHTGIFVALDKGWFEKEGIKLKIIQPGGNMSVEQVVGANKADFGISFQEWVTNARVNGVPIVSLAAVIQHNTSGIAALAEKDLNNPRDYTGNSYGGWGLSIEKEILKSIVNGNGGNYEEIKFVNIGKGDLLSMLASDKFDLAWIFYAWDGIQAEMRGLDLNISFFKDYQHLVPDYYTPVIISSEKFIENNTDIVSRFMKAVSRGYNFAIHNPEESAEILLKYTPESDPELIKKSQVWLSSRYQDDAPYWGRQEYEVWDVFGDWMYQRGLINNEFKASSAFNNNFLPGNN